MHCDYNGLLLFMSILGVYRIENLTYIRYIDFKKRLMTIYNFADPCARRKVVDSTFGVTHSYIVSEIFALCNLLLRQSAVYKDFLLYTQHDLVLNFDFY